MPKFRTMRSNTPQEASHLLTNPDDYLLSTGRFLRKYSLDEFPQIISIIKGDMAFVGPRPALFNQHDLISQRDLKEISQLKPGITGWAQVNGRDELSIEEKVQTKVSNMKTELNLTDDQTKKITVILTENYSALKAEKAKIKALEKNVSKIKRQGKESVKAVLTEDQVAKMKKKKK